MDPVPLVSPDPFASIALAGAGMMLAHQIGYLSEPGSSAGHEYFTILGPFALIAAATALWAGAVSVLRRQTAMAPSFAHLVSLQLALFMVIEVAERAIGDAPGSLLSRPVLLGLLAQPAVAWTARRLLRLGSRLLLWASRSRGISVGCLSSFSPAPRATVPSLSWMMHQQARGPPLV